MTTGSTGSLFPKWQLALLLGAPVAIGLGYLYYRNNQSLSNDELDDNKKEKKTLNDINKSQTLSLDEESSCSNVVKATTTAAVPSTKQPLTPFEEAKQYKNNGNELFKKGVYDEAIAMYDEAIRACPTTYPNDLATFYQNRAAAYEQLKRWGAVRDDSSAALDLNPRYIKALHRRARANEHLNDLAASLEDITATCILEGFQNNTSLMLADQVLKRMGREDAKKAIEKRIPTLPSNQFIKTYFASFTQDPIEKMPPLTGTNGFAKAKQALSAEQYEDIIPACTEEIELSEWDGQYKSEATLLRGTFYMLKGSKTEALADFDTLINNEDALVALRVNALLKKASTYVQSENVDKGFELFNEAEKLDPNCSDIYHQRGQVYILLERYDEAVKSFTEASRLAPEHGSTFAQRTFAAYRSAILEQNELALYTVMEDFKNAIDKYPDCIECYSIMAQVLSEQGQFESADTFFVKAIARAPTNAAMYVHRAVMHLQWNGDINKSLEFINKAIAIDAKCELAYETLGTIEVQRGYLDKAVELFETALSLAKTEAEMVHLFALRNAAIAQINVAKRLGIDMSTLSALAAANM